MGTSKFSISINQVPCQPSGSPERQAKGPDGLFCDLETGLADASLPYLESYDCRGGVPLDDPDVETNMLGEDELNAGCGWSCEGCSEAFTRSCGYYLDIQEVFGWGPSAMEDELYRSESCGSLFAECFGSDSMTHYYKRIDCGKWWCPECGGKGGRVHRRRVSAILNRIPDVRNMLLRKFVFTIPESERGRFKSRQGIARLFKAAKRVVEDFFGKGFSAYASVHLSGDKRPGFFHPHINVHVPVTRKGAKWLCSEEELTKLSESWQASLKGLGCHDVDAVKINYKFSNNAGSIMLALRYMARPLGHEDLDSMWEDEEMKRLCIIGLKGFQFIRFWGGLANSMYKEGCLKSELQEASNVIGEKLIFVRLVTRSELDGKYREGIDYDEVFDGMLKVRKERADKIKRR